MVAHLASHVKFIKSVITGKASTEKNYRIAVGVLEIVGLILLSFAPVTAAFLIVKEGSITSIRVDKNTSNKIFQYNNQSYARLYRLNSCYYYM